VLFAALTNEVIYTPDTLRHLDCTNSNGARKGTARGRTLEAYQWQKMGL
jgi:hypothetical protein